MSRWAISSESIHGTIKIRYVGGTAVDFGTAHVIHRSVIHPARRSSELPSQIGAERKGERFQPAKLLFGSPTNPRLSVDGRHRAEPNLAECSLAYSEYAALSLRRSR